MHISRRALTVTITSLLISGTLLGGVWFFLHTITLAEVTVEGGHLLQTIPGHITCRADTPNLNLTFTVPPHAILSTQLLTLHNLANDRVLLTAFPAGTRIVHGDATTLHLVLPPLPSGRHEVALTTQPVHDDKITIAVFGDSQGFNDALATIVADVNQREVDFAFHLGDITPSGHISQYSAAASVLDDLTVPLYATPGNHDIKGNGTINYAQFFGHHNVVFTYGGVNFISVDTSSLGLNTTLQTWLEYQLQQADNHRIVVYTHVPPVDPRLGYDHGFLDSQQADAFLALMNQYNVTLVMNGHIHLYNTTTRDEVLYLTSGGAGAALVADPDQGGFHHYVLVTLSLQETQLQPQLIEVPPLPLTVELRNAVNFTMTLGLHDLESLANIQRWGQYENLYGNLRGYGLYHGVLVSSLLGLIGDMNPNQLLVVEAHDGYQQTYGFANVYPNASWYQLQGDFILAFQCNTTSPPDWTDGPRLAFLPLDGVYSNTDCEATSYPGQGYHLYPSAGARWVRTVIRLQLLNAP